MKSTTVKIIDPAGLHARPASILTTKASSFQSDMYVVFNGNKMNMKSIIGLMSLGITADCEIEIIIVGTDEDLAMEAIIGCLKDNGLIN